MFNFYAFFCHEVELPKSVQKPRFNLDSFFVLSVVLCLKSAQPGNYCIDEESWNQLILLLKKDFTKTQSQFMFDMLDWEDKGYLDVLDFLNITEALTLHYKVRNMASSIENTRYGVYARLVDVMLS